jgi:hypothetical protein
MRIPQASTPPAIQETGQQYDALIAAAVRDIAACVPAAAACVVACRAAAVPAAAWLLLHMPLLLRLTWSTCLPLLLAELAC